MFPTVTQLDHSSIHVPPKGNKVRLVEGHVPQGVEVQVLSSAQNHGTQLGVFRHHVPYGGSYGNMVFILYR
jgi:hypothetical protein